MDKIKSFWHGAPKWLRMTFLSALSVLVLGGGIYGILVLIRGQGSTVNVYSAMDLCTYYASSGGAQSEGRVTTDKIQSVYISSTQQVTEVNVKEGDTVHVGDPILTFDTTLTDLELERQRIKVSQLQLDLENAKKRQIEINSYRVQVNIPTPTDTPQEDLPASQLPLLRKGSGTQEDPWVYVWNDACSYSSAFIDRVLPHAGGTDPLETYAVFEVRTGDSLQGSIQRSWEIVFRRAADDSWSFAVLEPDYDESDGEDPGGDNGTVPDYGPSYSWNDLVQMKREAAQKIIDLELELKMAQLQYETLEYELTNGVVLSKIDGVVKTVLDIEEARDSGKPMVLISGGGGYYITGALSETELSTMSVGSSVSIRSWENYENLTGTIVSISQYPTDYTGGYYYHYSEGNQNVSLYPFTVFVSEDANLRENEYVQITYDPGSSQGGSGLCLQNAFIRTENGKSYIWCAGENGRLEKRSIQTGRSLWGSYLEVLSGLSETDLIAFPYGRSLKEGARTKQASTSELYSY